MISRQNGQGASPNYGVPQASGRPQAARLPGWLADTRMSRFTLFLMGYYLFDAGLFREIFFERGSDAGSLVTKLIKVTIIAGAMMVLGQRARLGTMMIREGNRGMWAMMVLAVASVAWSINSTATIGRCFSLYAGVGMAMIFVLTGWHPRRFQAATITPIMLLLVGALLVGAYDRHLVVHEATEGTLANAWYGLSGQKNMFGQIAGFGAIILLNTWLSGERRGPQIIVGFVISLLCVVLSRSSTSLIATVLALMMMVPMLYAPPGLRRYLPYLTATFAIIVVLYAFTILKVIPGLDFLLSPVTSMTGKDMTFSNRSVIWEIIKENIADHPWLGSGFGAYWVGPNDPSSPSFQFLARMWFYPSESHNGYLEIVNDLGRPGLLALLAFFAIYIRQSLRLMRIDRPQGVLFIAMFFFQSLINLSESGWFMTYSPMTFEIMMLAVICTARALVEAKARAALQRAPTLMPAPAPAQFAGRRF